MESHPLCLTQVSIAFDCRYHWRSSAITTDVAIFSGTVVGCRVYSLAPLASSSARTSTRATRKWTSTTSPRPLWPPSPSTTSTVTVNKNCSFLLTPQRFQRLFCYFTPCLLSSPSATCLRAWVSWRSNRTRFLLLESVEEQFYGSDWPVC
jgi:hypothetical protein